jgi:hypothetical protein
MILTRSMGLSLGGVCKWAHADFMKTLEELKTITGELFVPLDDILRARFRLCTIRKGA